MIGNNVCIQLLMSMHTIKLVVGGGHLNMKKIIIPFLILVTLFIIGCNKTEVTSKENSIPFLTLMPNEKNHNIEAYLNYWDIEKGKIIQTDNLVYTSNKPIRYVNSKVEWSVMIAFAQPLSWDGENYIYLSSYYHEVKNPLDFKIKMFDDPLGAKEIIEKMHRDYLYGYSKNMQEQEKNVGPDYLYSKAEYGDFTFRIFDDEGNLVIEKNIKISLYNDIFHGGVSSGEAYLYEEDKKEIKELLLYYDNMGMGHFLICAINLESGKYTWNEVDGIEGCIPNMGQDEIPIIGSKFYVNECGGGIGIVNVDDYSYNTFLSHDEIQKLLSPYFSSTPSDLYYTLRGGGEYKDFIILNVYSDFGENPPSNNFKYLFMAIDTKTKDCVSVLEWNSLHPEVFTVKDKNGKKLSKISTDKLLKGISKVEDISGMLYTYGKFWDDGYICFPHKNGG